MKKKIPFKIQNNISYEFFLNYFILFVVLSITLYGTFIIIEKYEDERYDDKEYVQLEAIYEDYLENGMESAAKNSPYPIEFMEYVTEDLVITDAYQSPHEIGFVYTWDEFEEHLDNYYEYIFYYPYEYNDDVLLLFAPDFFAPPETSDIVIKAISIYTLFLMVLLFFYSKLTAKRIIRPIQHLNTAVDQIAQGNYHPFIPYESGNELGHLRDAIIHMGDTIHAGIQYRERAEKSRKQLLLNISHDLKTPLTNIRGYAETIAEELDMHPEAFRTYVEIIKSNSIRADLLIKDLFELSKIESEDITLRMSAFDLCEDLRRMIILHIPELENQEMAYEINIPNEKIMILADKLRLDRAIGNLMINSIRYSGKGTCMKINVRKLNKQVEITVEDNGPGMPYDLADTIFDPFVRADQARNVNSGGSGLGLAITRSIISKHRGTIELDRSYKEGCRFIINLPIYDHQ